MKHGYKNSIDSRRSDGVSDGQFSDYKQVLKSPLLDQSKLSAREPDSSRFQEKGQVDLTDDTKQEAEKSNDIQDTYGNDSFHLATDDKSAVAPSVKKSQVDKSPNAQNAQAF